jgi:hypothetical protein
VELGGNNMQYIFFTYFGDSSFVSFFFKLLLSKKSLKEKRRLAEKKRKAKKRQGGEKNVLAFVGVSY